MAESAYLIGGFRDLPDRLGSCVDFSSFVSSISPSTSSSTSYFGSGTESVVVMVSL